VNKQKKLGSANSHCAVAFGWSPCSRFFLTATCAPRMNVDNCVKLFRYTGSLLLKQPHDQLYDARWRPASPSAFADRPHSPERVTSAGGSGNGGAAPTAKVAAYRPPGSNGSLAAMMRAERDSGRSAGFAPKLGMGPGGTKRLPVGMAPPQESNAAKNKAKKDAKAKAKAAAEDAAAEMERLRVASGGAPAPVAPVAPVAAAAAVAAEFAAAEPVDPAKQLKKQMKALKAIEGLLAKQASGETLNGDQRSKLATEAAVRADIAALEAELKA
jgi:translation initiation factor 2A